MSCDILRCNALNDVNVSPLIEVKMYLTWNYKRAEKLNMANTALRNFLDISQYEFNEVYFILQTSVGVARSRCDVGYRRFRRSIDKIRRSLSDKR